MQKCTKEARPAKQPYVGKKFVNVAKLDSATNLHRSDSPDQVVFCADDTELQPIDKPVTIVDPVNGHAATPSKF